MINKPAIFAGGLGGVAPSLIRLILNYSSRNPQPMSNRPVFYCLALLGFAVLGALIVWAFQEADLKQSLFLGISLPSLLLSGSLSTAPSSSPPLNAPPDAGTHGASISLISSAYAQEQPPSSPSSAIVGRKLNLTVDKNLSFTVAFYGSDNTLIKGVVGVKNPASVDVPSDAAKFALQVRESTSASYPLPNTSGAVIKAEVRIEEKTGSGFFQGVGLTRAPQYDITVSVQ